MIQLRHLRYFVGIVDAGSLSRAATTLYVAQPALSQQMAEPTPAGDALYREAQAILRHVEKLPDIVRDSGGEVAGAVSLGMSSTVASFLAGPFIDACRTALPRVNLSLVTEDSMTLKSRIDAHGLDLAVVFEQEATPGQALALALAAREALQADGTPTAVVSMPSWELFAAQDASYRASVLGSGSVRVGCEAALRFGWDRWLGEHGGFVGMTGFGASGPAEVLYPHFGITPEAIVAEAHRLLAVQPESAIS